MKKDLKFIKLKNIHELWKQDSDTAARKRSLTLTNYIHIPNTATTGHCLKLKIVLNMVWSNTDVHKQNQT